MAQSTVLYASDKAGIVSRSCRFEKGSQELISLLVTHLLPILDLIAETRLLLTILASQLAESECNIRADVALFLVPYHRCIERPAKGDLMGRSDGTGYMSLGQNPSCLASLQQMV